MQSEYNQELVALSHLELKKRRRDGSAEIYSDNQSRITRIGRLEDIQAERANHECFFRLGLAVPQLLTPVITVDNQNGYYQESWLGRQSLGRLAVTHPMPDRIDNALFEDVARLAGNLSRVQVKDSARGDISAFAEEVSFSTILQRSSFPELMREFLKRSSSELEDVPATMCHGDFNVFNMFSGGVIDFQKSRRLLFGFDQVFCMINPYLFPPEGTERNRCYRFSFAQVSELHAQFEAIASQNRLPPLTRYQDSLSIWVLINFLLHNDPFPQFRDWRYLLLKRLIGRYLSGEEVFWALVSEACDE